MLFSILVITASLGLLIALPPQTFAENYSYSPLRVGQSPDGELPTDQQIMQDIEQLARQSEKIRVYDTVELEPILRHSYIAGLKVSVEVTTSEKIGIAQSNINDVVALSERYPGVVDSIIIGNNDIFEKKLTVDQVCSYIEYAQSLSTIPITSVNSLATWMIYPELVQKVDYIMMDSFTMYESQDDPIQAVELIKERYDRLSERYPYKHIVVESGWSTVDSSKQKQVQFIDELSKTGIDTFIFEYTDEDWKVDPVQAGFGSLTADREIKSDDTIADWEITITEKEAVSLSAVAVVGTVSAIGFIEVARMFLTSGGSEWGKIVEL